METVEEDGFLKTVAPPTPIFADNQGAIKLTSNPEYHRKIKRIPIKYHNSRELVKDRSIIFDWLPTQGNLAEGLTKSLGATKFREFVRMMGMVDTSLLPELVREGLLKLCTNHCICSTHRATCHVFCPFWRSSASVPLFLFRVHLTPSIQQQSYLVSTSIASIERYV